MTSVLALVMFVVVEGLQEPMLVLVSIALELNGSLVSLLRVTHTEYEPCSCLPEYPRKLEDME